jgi:predicted dithiol-disulfide oxidoreductase (DUF899 family)
MSAYALENGTVYLTYSTTARGLEYMMGYYGLLDAPRTAATRGIRPSSGYTATTSTTTRTRASMNPSPR